MGSEIVALSYFKPCGTLKSFQEYKGATVLSFDTLHRICFLYDAA